MNNKHWSITKKTFQDLSKEAPLVSSLIDFTQSVLRKELSKSQKDLISSLLTANRTFNHTDSYHIVSPKIEFDSKHFQSMVNDMIETIREANEIKLYRWLLNAFAHFGVSSIEEARSKGLILIQSSYSCRYMLVELAPTGPVILSEYKI